MQPREIWSISHQLHPMSEPVTNGALLILLEMDAVRAIDLATGTEAWRHAIATPSRWLVASPDGPIVAFAALAPGGGEDIHRSSIVAWDWKGLERWRVEISGSVIGIGLGTSGLLVGVARYAPAFSTALTVRNLATGSLLGERACPEGALTDLVVGGDMAFYEGPKGVHCTSIDAQDRVAVAFPTEWRPELRALGPWIAAQATAPSGTESELAVLDASRGIAAWTARRSKWLGRVVLDERELIWTEPTESACELVARRIDDGALTWRRPLVMPVSPYAAIGVALSPRWISISGQGDESEIELLNRSSRARVGAVAGQSVVALTDRWLVVDRLPRVLTGFALP